MSIFKHATVTSRESSEAPSPLHRPLQNFVLPASESETGFQPRESMGGPMFLIPDLVIGSYVTGLPPKEYLEMIRYVTNYANEHGGWGRYAS